MWYNGCIERDGDTDPDIDEGGDRHHSHRWWQRGADMTGTMHDVVVGAQMCVAYWQEQGDEYMIADAQARLDRVINGIANDVDIEGALDWLDMIDDID